VNESITEKLNHVHKNKETIIRTNTFSEFFRYTAQNPKKV